MSTWNGLRLRLVNAGHFTPFGMALGAVLAGGLAEFALVMSMPLFVFATTGSMSQAGSVIFAILGFAFMVRFLVGPNAERLGLRRIGAWAAAIEAVVVAVIAVLFWTDSLSFPVLFALLALLGGVGGAGTLAKDNLVPRAASYVGVRESVGVSFNAAVLIGGQAAGLSLGSFLGSLPMVALLVSAALFVANVLFILAMPREMAPAPAPAGRAAGEAGYWKSQGAGVKYVRKHDLLSRVAVMLFTVEFLNAPLNGVMLPAWADKVGVAAGEIPVIVTLAAVAGFVGSLVAIRVGDKVRPWLIVSVTYPMIALQMIALGSVALGVDVPLSWVKAIWFAAGFCGSFAYAEAEKVKYQVASAEFRTRTMSVMGSFQRSGSAFGPLVLPVAVTAFGLGALLPCAAVFMAVTQSTVLSKRFRALPPGVSAKVPETGLVKEPTG
ncbi:MFS transporter [Streptomyces sp. WMMB303]|uniref:MFS transporter n=1 Tax=Streptomyces sp. WMMB303 TaxID=3034154 RepID=UPI0023ED251D|nr:MFS transporter [Streptomyces sp. WMMB303]MDF4254559.1 hypothetical protein [Streptomyces sp. WMMB303]